MGTLMMLNKKLLAIIELNELADKKSVTEKIATCGITFDKVIFLKKIPRDPRHNSKIDYALLQRELKASFD